MFDYPNLYTYNGQGHGDIYRENFPGLDRCSESPFCDKFVEDPFWDKLPLRDRPSGVEPCLACKNRRQRR